jgi:DNA ligase-1
MPDLLDGETAHVQGSARKPYELKNIGGVYSCSCPAWRNQSLPIERRSCKHLRQYRGEEAERQRLGGIPSVASPSAKADKPKAPALLLADKWSDKTDPSGWWLSEKLDGVRAYWDGRQFLSRQGNRFHAPDWFTEGLPSTPMDGELWIGRKQFQRTVSIVRRQDQSDHWREVKYLIFDAPNAGGRFEARLAHLIQNCRELQTQFAEVLPQHRCLGKAHLLEELGRINSLCGEGLMLRQPGSNYEPGRSSTLLKVKTFHDAEARVIGHQPGTGRHYGRLGALLVALPNGTEFAVGSGFTDAERELPPRVGTKITFRYQELTDGGVPRFPTFVRVRPDEQGPV